MTDDEKAQYEKEAQAQGVTLSAYIRGLHKDTKKAGVTEASTPVTSAPIKAGVTSTTPAPVAPETHHIDDLGDDPLRVDTGALDR
ncbi:MAG: hypothetical protein KAT00_12845 [Planctomycetes bacterium]|nr:hypothetical protein [Planctomycetota bacterium]